MTLLSLDPNVHLFYLAEGAANIVYKIRDGGNNSLYSGKLLRLRKAAPTVMPVLESHTRFKTTIAPSFPRESLVEQTLIALPSERLKVMNVELCAMDNQGVRPKKRHGSLLDEGDKHGLLVTDMTSDYRFVCLDFKPKWLAQSPNAPEQAIRCRTCALNARRAQGERLKKVFCPLKLVRGDREDVRDVISKVLSARPPKDPQCSSEMEERLVGFLHQCPLIDRLHSLQTAWDQTGTLGTDHPSEDLSKAMTVRDCTLFLKVPIEPELPIEARLGDLDVKPASEKAAYWKSIETTLRDEGWYTATESDVPAKAGDQCWLSRTR